MLPTTSSMLLQGLRNPENALIWSDFDGRYRPVLFAFARKLGLLDEDAREVVQETLAAFVEAFRAGKYDRDRGRLRSWLLSIARTRVAGVKRRAERQGPQRGESALFELPDDERMSAIWEAQWRETLLCEGLRQLRAGSRLNPKTLAAFEQTTLQARAPAEVARELDLSIEAVYIAKSRTLQRLQKIVARLEKDW